MQIIGKCGHMLCQLNPEVLLTKQCPAKEFEEHVIKQAKKDFQGLLRSLEAASTHLELQELGLHEYIIPHEFIPLLGTIFGNLSNTLTELWLSTVGYSGPFEPYLYRGTHKAALFRAIARLRRLRVLTMLHWEEFVGPDVEAVEPLLSLQNLKSVYVRDVTDSPAFMVDLKFTSLQAAFE